MFAYFDCSSGIAGDMVLGALIDLGVSVDFLNEQVQSLVPKVHIGTETVQRKNLRAVHAVVHCPQHNHEHSHGHRHLSDILKLLEKSKLSDRNKKSAADIFQIIAKAEAKVHGIAIEEVHFHEVGADDSIADIVGCVVGLDKLGITEIHSSSIPTGTGTVEIAHGSVSIPAPATAELLHHIPVETSGIPFELTTPTGAAIIKYFVKQFSPLPSMTIQASGVGAGTRDFAQQPNVLRIITGTLTATEGIDYTVAEHQFEDLLDNHFAAHAPTKENAWIVETNIDNMTGEMIGHCIDRLWTLDVLDIWTTSIQMKKQRPGVMISVLCNQEQRDAVEKMLLLETTTLGVRYYQVGRTVLFREQCQLKTAWGELTMKQAVLPDGTKKVSPEFESIKELAASKGLSVRELLQRLGAMG